MIKKILACTMTLLLAVGCSANSNPELEGNDDNENNPSVLIQLPEKPQPDSALMSDSPIDPTNIDDYMFLPDVLYIDLRSSQQCSEEGTIAGFTNIPFYGTLVNYQKEENVLYRMEKIKDENGKVIASLGEIGSFSPNYEESEAILKDIFPEDKKIIFFSSAGVEAAYMISLLMQLGYDGANLYNAGTFTNGMGDIIAYRNYPEAKYYIPGTNVYSVNVHFNWDGSLTEIK